MAGATAPEAAAAVVAARAALTVGVCPKLRITLGWQGQERPWLQHADTEQVERTSIIYARGKERCRECCHRVRCM